ncbi:MAG TPA: DUF4394 domain-containing protein [Longimicrobium sp.]|jgi:hypothetical protein
MIRWKATLCALLLVTACKSSTEFDVDGVRIYGLDGANNLVEFGSRSADAVRRREISGLQPGEVLVGIDYRAGNANLYGVGNTSRLYVIDARDGEVVATPVAGPFVPALEGEAFGTDFHPGADRLRVHGSGGQNLRLDPAGTVSATDPPLTYAPGDPGAITTPRIAGTAYTTGTPTLLYGIDSNRDVLVTFPNSDAGVAKTVGPLGLNTSDDVGFDIVVTREGPIAFAVLSETRVSRLYRIDLATGTPTLIGRLATRTPIRSIAVPPGQTARP